MLESIQVWQALFDEPFPNLSITLDRQGAAVVITHLLAHIWETRYPLWQAETLFAQVNSLIGHLQRHPTYGRQVALNLLQVDCLQVYLTLGRRYAELFPEDTTWPDGIDALDEESLSLAVGDFLSAVGRDYFPVEEDVWVMEVDFLAGRLETIDLIPYGHELDPDFADELEEYEEPLQTLLRLARDEWKGPGLELYRLGDVLDSLPLPQPLAETLPTAVRLVSHNTDNCWLDWSYGDLAQGSFMLPEWNQENVAFLKEAWEEARALLAQETALIRWVEEGPPTRLAAVRGALYLAYIQQGVDHELRPRHPYDLSRSHASGEGPRRWLSHHPSHLAGRSGRGPEPDPALNGAAAP
jgi:hypothetical protein